MLIEKGVATSCKVAKGRGNRELDGFQLAPVEDGLFATGSSQAEKA